MWFSADSAHFDVVCFGARRLGMAVAPDCPYNLKILSVGDQIIMIFNLLNAFDVWDGGGVIIHRMRPSTG